MDKATEYSTDAAKVMNSKRMYEKPFSEMMYLASQFGAYEVRGDLPPDLRSEFEECLASGPFEPGTSSRPVEV